ncbi:hypothetical protein CLCR_01428 [Cladophialophora carrionii]|uniref:Heterokaryon incompatibility domain-containing protein n=1 Tax=Cladophialophora carrionii TaxID=86049 RepID=A0A1C1CBK4_9EURO|nr:hypothetical protein CLCR_01428 [Cladophialophora carrionii]
MAGSGGGLCTPETPPDRQSIPKHSLALIMDHLPRASADAVHIEVPYLFDEDCPFKYDNQAWAEYPVRTGWDLDAFFDGDFTNKGRNTATQAASFFQAWLYFGMLHCVTGIPVDTSLFVRTNDQGSRLVSLVNLGSYLSRWEEAVSTWPADERASRTAAADAAAKVLTHTLVQHLGWKTPLPDTVVLSITILHRTLMCAKRSMLTQSDFEPRLNYHQGSRDILDNRLYELGWCRRDVARHHQGQSCLVMYYAISLGPRLVPRDHSTCVDTECLALQVDHATYRAQHVTPSCACSHLAVEVNQVCSLIDQGLVPVVRLSPPSGPEEPPQLHVLAHRDDYVCISHVWANGFGNLEANSLPLCQLERIQRHVNALYQGRSADVNVPFWIDTLCVPVQPENYALRRRAIVQMRTIYEQADKVLVVDVELLRSSTAEASDEEVAMRISYSVWWSRLWTLQEAVCARELYFQFQDGALNGIELVRRSDEGYSSSRHNDNHKDKHEYKHNDCGISSSFTINDTSTSKGKCNSKSRWTPSEQIAWEGLNYLRELYAYKEASSDRASRATMFLQAVTWRSTSWASDEAICLAGILGLDVHPILHASPPTSEGRLRTFILLQRLFPAIVLFFSGAKMDVDNFRWAPRTFVFSRASLLPAYQRHPDRGVVLGRFERQTALAEADAKGLHVRFPAFRMSGSLRGRSRAGGGRVLFQDAATAWWYTFRVMDGTVASPFLDTTGTGTGTGTGTDLLADIPNLAIVLPRLPTPDRSFYYGVLVSIYEEEGEEEDQTAELAARFVARASLDQWGAKDVMGIRISLGIQDPNPVMAASLGEDQRWCIG